MPSTDPSSSHPETCRPAVPAAGPRRRAQVGRTLGIATVAALAIVSSCTKTDQASPPTTATSKSSSGSTAAAPTTDADRDNPDTNPGSNSSGTAKLDKLAPGPILVVALGDSLTAGDGDDTDLGGYPGRLSTAIESSGRTGTRVVNYGAAGWDSTQLLAGQDGTPAQVPQAVGALTNAKAGGQPTVALVLVGSNDLWYLYANDAPTTTEEEQDNLKAYRSNLTKIVSALRGAGAVVVLAINDDQSKRPVAADDAKRTAAFAAISRDEVAKMSVQATRYADVVREVAAANGNLIVVDFLHAPFFTNPALLADDGNHPNAKGYEEMTKTWLAALQPIL